MRPHGLTSFSSNTKNKGPPAPCASTMLLPTLRKHTKYPTSCSLVFPVIGIVMQTQRVWRRTDVGGDRERGNSNNSSTRMLMLDLAQHPDSAQNIGYLRGTFWYPTSLKPIQLHQSQGCPWKREASIFNTSQYPPIALTNGLNKDQAKTLELPIDTPKKAPQWECR